MWAKTSYCYWVFKCYYLAKSKLVENYLAKMQAVAGHYFEAKQSKTNFEKVVGFLK